MRAIVKSRKWYGRFWPPERRKVKIMQAIIDLRIQEIELEVNKYTGKSFYGMPIITRDYVPDNEFWIVPASPFGASRINLKDK